MVNHTIDYMGDCSIYVVHCTVDYIIDYIIFVINCTIDYTIDQESWKHLFEWQSRKFRHCSDKMEFKGFWGVIGEGCESCAPRVYLECMTAPACLPKNQKKLELKYSG